MKLFPQLSAIAAATADANANHVSLPIILNVVVLKVLRVGGNTNEYRETNFIWGTRCF